MKKRMTIWLALVIFIFFVLLITILVAIFLYALASKLGLSDNPSWASVQVLVFIMLISLVFGTILTALSSKIMMKFIFQFRDATRQITEGNFSVRLEETSRIHEINTLLSVFNKMVKDLGSIETLKDDFITNVSHEIKTPIAAIEGCVELLKESTLTEEETKEYINLLDISAKRLSVMTANVLRISKLDNQEVLQDQAEFSLDEQIRQAILLLEHNWSAKDINLNINLNPVNVFANKELLMQVWINLIDNAIKFSEAGGDISVELLQSENSVTVKVTDYGIGMTEDTTEYIFQKFYQGNESRSNQGNGLGLALVKRIVELTGGNVSVESRFGEGSVFSVELPLPDKMKNKA